MLFEFKVALLGKVDVGGNIMNRKDQKNYDPSEIDSRARGHRSTFNPFDTSACAHAGRRVLRIGKCNYTRMKLYR